MSAISGAESASARGVPRDTVTRSLAHEPFGRRPTTLLIRIRRYKCAGCGPNPEIRATRPQLSHEYARTDVRFATT